MPLNAQVECLRIERKTVGAQKQPVYFLSLHWDGGRVSEVEKSHSAFVELRTFLKKTFYSDRRDVQIPEVPAAKKFEIGTSAKKDEKKRKLIEDFCLQLVKLPDVDGKISPVREFFGAFDESGVYKLAAGFEDDGAYSTAEILENEVSKAGVRLPQEKVIKGTNISEKKNLKEREQDGKQLQGKANGVPKKETAPADLNTLYAEVNKPKPINYIEVDVQSTGKGERLNHGTHSPETMYAEIGPSTPERPKASAPTVPPPKGGVKLPAPTALKQSSVEQQQQQRKAEPVPVPFSTQRSEKPHSKAPKPMPEVPSFPVDKKEEEEEEEEGENGEDNETIGFGPQYQNFPITSPNVSEKKLYIVTQSFIPNTAFSQFLSVENGDIVEVQAMSGDKFFCSLHATQLRPIEGWLPRKILQPCTAGASSNSKSTSSTQNQNLPPKVLSRKISPDVPKLPHAGHSIDSFVPIMPIPPKPSTSSHSSEDQLEPRNTSTSNELKVIAMADYKSEDDNILSFEKGLLAELISGEDPDWWCIRIGFVSGWVPANCWKLVQVDGTQPVTFDHFYEGFGFTRILRSYATQSRQETSGSTSPSQMKIVDAPYFIGRQSRSHCEDLLMKYGLHLDFVVRESSNLVGQFALSVRHNDHVHHFPIALTEDNKYYIGKHRFKTIENVISYYQRNDLFIDDDGSAVRLGNPFIQPAKGSYSTDADV